MDMANLEVRRIKTGCRQLNEGSKVYMHILAIWITQLRFQDLTFLSVNHIVMFWQCPTRGKEENLDFSRQKLKKYLTLVYPKGKDESFRDSIRSDRNKLMKNCTGKTFDYKMKARPGYLHGISFRQNHLFLPAPKFFPSFHHHCFPLYFFFFFFDSGILRLSPTLVGTDVITFSKIL